VRSDTKCAALLPRAGRYPILASSCSGRVRRRIQEGGGSFASGAPGADPAGDSRSRSGGEWGGSGRAVAVSLDSGLHLSLFFSFLPLGGGEDGLEFSVVEGRIQEQPNRIASSCCPRRLAGSSSTEIPCAGDAGGERCQVADAGPCVVSKLVFPLGWRLDCFIHRLVAPTLPPFRNLHKCLSAHQLNVTHKSRTQATVWKP
jgi:hypothetical protein